jgi:hypothetical protein
MALAATMAAAALAASPRQASADSYPERTRATVRQTLAFSGQGPYRLEVDNVFGAIRIAAHEGGRVELAAPRVTFAREAADATLAAREVTLDVREEGGTVRVYVDGPFRECRDGRRRSWSRRDYLVRYDIVIEVPRGVEIAARTVNDGDIRVSGVTRGFDVENVNGAVELLDVAVGGRARTVNGGLHVVFRENPSVASSFGSVNGDVVVQLKPGLSADVRLETFNGRVYTDFDVTRLPALEPESELRGGRHVYRTSRAFGVRIGRGGPELSFDALNGDIRILQGGR